MNKKNTCSSGDYAGMRNGKYDFYYGYEQTIPINVEDDEDYEWAFVACENGIEVIRCTAKDLGHHQFDDATDVLLSGIATWLSKKGLNSV
jgi:hypothetical protein